jgi:hypothetical protein
VEARKSVQQVEPPGDGSESLAAPESQTRKVLEKATGFNRPDRLDALLTPIVEGLLEALPRLARDAAVGVIVPAWVAARVAYDGCSPSVVRAT